MTAAAVERDAAIVACACSAGIHAALAPRHFAGGTAAGTGFVAAAVLLAVLAVALTFRPGPGAAAGAAAVFAGLLAGYALAVTSGIPLLHPEPDPVDGLGLFTKLVELGGLLAAVRLTLPEPKGART